MLCGKIYANNIWVVGCMINNDVILRKRITAILRHGKKTVNSNGWISLYRLSKIINIPIKTIKSIVKSDNERYEYSGRLNMVRAKRGHTNGVKIESYISKPPEILYYGIEISDLFNTLNNGSSKMVHLVATRKFARNGIRRDRSVVLSVLSGRMYRDGYVFSKSIYDEWYVDCLPLRYICLVV